MVETRASQRKREGGNGRDGNGKRQRGECSGTVVTATVNSKDFSWAAPSRYGITGWGEGESPLPEPMDQGKLDACIAAAVKHTIEIQLGMLAKQNPQIEVPRISFQHLYHVLTDMPVRDRTLKQMLLWVETYGAVAEGNYNQETRQVTEGRRYYLDWSTVPTSGLNPKHKSFIREVKSGVLRLGGTIGEFQIRADYDDEGKNIYRAEELPLPDKEGNGKDSGHATVIMGWGVQKDDDGYPEEYFEYLDSKGIDFGVNGRGKLLSTGVLHWVYQPELRRWF